MVSIGFALIILGVLLVFGSFLYALYNMASYTKNFFGDMDAGFDDMGSSFGGMFQKHLGSMAGVATGGFMIVVGLVLAVLGSG